MYDNAPYVRKRKITSLLFSNMIITPEKQVVFKAKSSLDRVFTTDNGDNRENFEHVNIIIRDMDFNTLRPIIQFSYSLNKTFFDENYKITPEQKTLYGLE